MLNKPASFLLDTLSIVFAEVASFMKSKYGNDILVDRYGYTYRSNLKRNDKIYWKCGQSSKFECGARAITHGIVVINWSGFHNHTPPPKRM